MSLAVVLSTGSDNDVSPLLATDLSRSELLATTLGAGLIQHYFIIHDIFKDGRCKVGMYRSVASSFAPSGLTSE